MLDESVSIPDERKFVTDPAMSNAAPNWANPFWDSVDPEQEMKRLRESFDSGGMVRIDARVNVRSRRDGVGPEEGRLLILMRKSEEETATTLFARHGMTIPFMDSAKGAVALVIAQDDDPLSKILRHAEGPAHLEWNRGASRIGVKAGIWHHGQTTVDFVRNSVKSLLEIMKPDDEVETHASCLCSGLHFLAHREPSRGISRGWKKSSSPRGHNGPMPDSIQELVREGEG